MKKKIIPAIAAILLIISLLTGCSAAEPWSFTIIDANTGSETTYSSESGGSISLDGALVYRADGGVIKTDSASASVKSSGVRLNGQNIGVVTGIITGVGELAQITDVYDIAAASLDANENVMIIYLDGFGWDTYTKALDKGLMPSLSTMTAEKAASMFPTITPVNYAAMVTGETPDVTGVTGRGIHEISCETIFDYCASMGGKAYVVESDVQLFGFSCEQELCPDFDGSGDTDGEITDAALTAMEKESPNLLFVHLHGIDDTSHQFSPDSDELLEKLAETDGYLQKLMSRWGGRVIICADHGQHTNDGNGDPTYADREGIHGAFTASDIFTPILTN